MAGTVRLHSRRRQQEGPPEAVGLDDGVIPAPLSWFWRLFFFAGLQCSCFSFVFLHGCVLPSVCALPWMHSSSLVLFPLGHFPKWLASTILSHASASTAVTEEKRSGALPLDMLL